MRKLFTYLQRLVDFVLPRDPDIVKMKVMPRDAIEKLFKPCKEILPSYLHALYSYRDPLVKKLVWHMKFKECRWVAEIFGVLLARRISVEKFESGTLKVLLMPVPIHSKRRRERGYNQCEWLCEEILKNIDSVLCTKIIYNANFIRRTTYTVKQSWSNKKDRQENIRGVFEVSNPSKITNTHIIIIDDVCTTGATLNEMRQTLLEAGAFSVEAFVVAH